jgi:hypothetical protein
MLVIVGRSSGSIELQHCSFSFLSHGLFFLLLPYPSHLLLGIHHYVMTAGTQKRRRGNRAGLQKENRAIRRGGAATGKPALRGNRLWARAGQSKEPVMQIRDCVVASDTGQAVLSFFPQV